MLIKYFFYVVIRKLNNSNTIVSVVSNHFITNIIKLSNKERINEILLILLERYETI